MTILVVDDEQDIRALLVEMLKSILPEDELTIVEAPDGLAGLKELGKQKFDLVFTDHQMPKMTGEQLAPQIKAKWPTVPVIMVTGNWAEFEDEGPPEGVDRIIGKPFNLQTMERVLAELIT